MRDVDKRFQGAHALAKASLEVAPAEIMALVGQNGAGKSTMIKVLTGAYARDAGEVHLRRPAGEFRLGAGGAGGGVSTIYQEVNLVPFRTVTENIFLGREPRRFGFLDWRRMNAEAAELLQPLRRRHRRAPAADGLLDRDPADGRHRPRGFVQGQARHHGRADLLARRARGRGAVRRHAAIASRGRRGDLRLAPARRIVRGVRPRDRDARRPHGAGEPNGRHRQARARRRRCSAAIWRRFAPEAPPASPPPRPRAGAQMLSAEGLQDRPARARRARRGAARAKSSASPACSAPAAPKPRARSSAPTRRRRRHPPAWARRCS